MRDVEGALFGIEVCLDHDIGMLSRQARPDRPVDIQLILSDAVQMVPANLSALRNDGWLIHGSTADEENGVWQKTASGLTPAKSLGSNQVGGTALTHWQMDLGVHDPYDLSETFLTKGMEAPARRWPTVLSGKFRSTG